MSSDKDLLQLVSQRTAVYNFATKQTLGVADVQDVWGVPPQAVPHVQALAGDAADGIPGCRGIGVKTAAKLVAGIV